MELTDEHFLGTFGHRGQQNDLSVAKESLTVTARMPWIALWGIPTNSKPDGAARDPVVRRQYITQRWVDEHGVTPSCRRREGRGTVSHSETCRKGFDAIEKKLDKQLEEATRNAEPPLVNTVEVEVEQPQELPMTGGASSSSGPAPSGQEAVLLSSFSSPEVRMEITESSGSRMPLEGLTRTTRVTGSIRFGRRTHHT